MVVAYAVLALAAAAAMFRLVVGPSLPDRVIALDLLLISLMSGIAIDAGVSGDTTYLKLLVVIAIIGFTATVSATAFIEREADRQGMQRGRRTTGTSAEAAPNTGDVSGAAGDGDQAGSEVSS